MKILLLVTERSIKISKQKNDLERVFGSNIELKTVHMSEMAGWKDIVKAGEDYDVLVGDFSMEVLMNLINPEKNTKRVICTLWQRIYGGYNYLGLEEVKIVFEQL